MSSQPSAISRPYQAQPAVRYGSPEVRAVIDAIRDSAAAAKSAGRSLHSTIDIVRASRLGALRVPVAEGGGGASVRDFFAMLIDLAEADADVAHILRAHYWFVEERLRSNNVVDRARWLAKIVDGEIFGNAMSEIGGGAAIGSWLFNTQLTPTEQGHVLNGKKYYCTGSLYCDWVNVYACTPEGTVVSAVIPVGRAGFVLEDDWDGIGQRLTGSGTGTLDNVQVLAEELLAASVESSDAASLTNPADAYLAGQICQLILTAIIAGILRNVVSDSIRLIRTRGRTYAHAAGETPAADPLLQQVVGEIASHSYAAEALVLAAAQAQDLALASAARGPVDFELAHRASLLAAQAKVVIDSLASRAATQLFDVGGSSAIKQSADFDRHWRNIRTLASHNPVVYKARAVGDYLINGTLLPSNGFF